MVVHVLSSVSQLVGDALDARVETFSRTYQIICESYFKLPFYEMRLCFEQDGALNRRLEITRAFSHTFHQDSIEND